MRTVLASLTGLLAVTLAPAAIAAQPVGRLVYTRGPGTESCDDEQALKQAVIARLGADPFSPGAPETVIVSLARAPGGGYSARVSLVDDVGAEHGAHELRADGSCAELIDTVALSIAIAIAPRDRLLSRSPSEPPPPPPEPPRPPAVTIEAPEEAVVPAPPRTSLKAALSAGGAFSQGTAPSPSVGGRLGVAARWRAVSVGVEGFADASASAPARGGGSVSTSLLGASVVPCGYVSLVFLCGVFEGGSMHATGDQVLGSQTSFAWWGAGGRLGSRVRVARWVSLELHDDVLADLKRPVLVLNGFVAWRAPAVANSVGVDAIVPFP